METARGRSSPRQSKSAYREMDPGVVVVVVVVVAVLGHMVVLLAM